MCCKREIPRKLPYSEDLSSREEEGERDYLSLFLAKGRI